MSNVDYTDGRNNEQHTTIVRAGGSDTGSETFILKDGMQDQVIKKTEITVVNSLR